MQKKFLLILALLGLLITSCNNDDDSGSSTATLTLNLNGLENLGSDQVYEGWIIVNGSPVSTGVFTVNDAGELSQTTFNVNAADLANATDFVLSLEPANDTDPAPADAKILSGSFSGSSASVDATAQVGDFSSAAGQYFLATPTTSVMTDEYSGIWFGASSALLTLPDLSNTPGWTYEGWVVMSDGTNNIPVSTGTFDNPAAADDNATTSTFKGSDGNGPSFPGEDFIMNAPTGLSFPTDIRGGTVVISIEPVPDNSTAPFTLKPLSSTIDAMQMTGGANTASLTRSLASFPTGTVTR